jgi:hypothetical protein
MSDNHDDQTPRRRRLMKSTWAAPMVIILALQASPVAAEYDGFADFPAYPINVLADLNAVAGVAFVHAEFVAMEEEVVALEAA